MKIAAGTVLCSAILSSCLDDGPDYMVNIASVNPISENAYSLVLDQGTKLWPASSNVFYKPKTNQRAMVNYTVLSGKFQDYDQVIRVNDIVDILTKDITSLNTATKDSLGNDPIAIRDYWIGDGYLNVIFSFPYVYGGEKHFINLAKNDTIGKPNYYEFLHNAYGDTKGEISTGIVAFNLDPLKTEGETSVEFTIKVKTFDGDKEYLVKYRWERAEKEKLSAPALDIIPRSITEVK